MEKAVFDFDFAKIAVSNAHPYKCQKCKDTGWIVNNDVAYPCSCSRDKVLAKMYKEAGITPYLQAMTFDGFDLSLYDKSLPIEVDGRQAVVNAQALAEDALTAAQNFSKSIIEGKISKGILLEGRVGRGKSFLAAAIANCLIDNYVDVLFLPVIDFLDKLRACYSDNSKLSEGEVLMDIHNRQVLILDDLGAHNNSDWTKDRIYSLINHRVNYNLPCIVTTNLNIDQLGEAIGARSLSRLIGSCEHYVLTSRRDFRWKK